MSKYLRAKPLLTAAGLLLLGSAVTGFAVVEPHPAVSRALAMSADAIRSWGSSSDPAQLAQDAVRVERTGDEAVATQNATSTALSMLMLSKASRHPATAPAADPIAQVRGDDVNAPWADLLSALPRASGSIEEPTKSGATSGSPQPDANPPPQPVQAPIAVTPAPAAENLLSDVPPETTTVTSETAGPEPRRVSGAKTPSQAIEPTQAPEPRSASREDAMAEPVGRKMKAARGAGVRRPRTRKEPREQLIRDARTAHMERRTARTRREVAPTPALQLPQGLIPSHATRHE